MTSAGSVLQLISDDNIQFVTFRFTDPRGKWQQVRSGRWPQPFRSLTLRGKYRSLLPPY